MLDRVADLLEVQDANPYRVRAYRRAAAVVRETEASVARLALTSPKGTLESLPGIGESIGATIREFAALGWLPLLQRLEGQVSPDELFASLPGLGEQLAGRIHDQLHIDTLEELELAAHDGRLEQVRGFGPRRAEALRDILAGLLSRSSRHRSRMVPVRATENARRPPVGLLLAIDAEYRREAAAGTLPTITPRRFNPRREAWLPILHTEAEGWSVTALFSNTARAHQLGTTRDWVILYYERNGDEGQATVVTERHGALAGRRVVRGREVECGAPAGARLEDPMLKTKPGKEVTVRTENQIGALDDIAKAIADRGINIVAVCAWVEGPQAVLRFVTDDSVRVLDLLEGRGDDVRQEDVLVAEMPHKPGMLHRITDRLAREAIGIHHLYASAAGAHEQSIVVFRTSNNDRALVLLNEAPHAA